MKLIVYSDGGSRGNPGPAAGGAVLYSVDSTGGLSEQVAEASKFLGVATNNIAEYTGIIAGLQKALALGADEVECRMDSELAVKQLNGQYRVKNPGIAELFLVIHNLRAQFKKVTFKHVRREANVAADALVNRVLDHHS